MECNEKLWNICDFGNNRKAWNLSGIMEHVENYGIRKKIIEHQLKDPALLVKKMEKNFLKKNLKKSVHKKFQPNQSSLLAGYTQHIYIRMSCFII